MRMDLTVTEVVELINQIRHELEGLFEMIRANVQETVGQYLSKLMDVELTEFLGRGRYERCEREADHRNGSYPRKFTLKGVGEVGVKVPRDRNGEFKTQVLPRSKQYEDALREDISVMFLAGVSTRSLSLISERLIGRKISAGEVSKVSSELTKAVEAWRERDLSGEPIKYLFVDGTLFSMRVEGSVEKVPVLVAIGVTVEGRRTVLGLQAGDKESATN
jgi:putative transposase